jgi:hypothetical protein
MWEQNGFGADQIKGGCMKRLIFAAIFVAGCANELENRTHIDFAPYVDEFRTLSTTIVPPIIIEYGHPSADGVAECKAIDGQRIITVDALAWDDLCHAQRRAVIFHELGHCVLFREHTLDRLSYMFATTLTCEHYMLNQSVMDSEMFGG